MAIMAYVGSFAFWWFSSPTSLQIQEGKTARFVELHMTPFRWHTIYLWLPAILFMEHVRGYHCVEVIAMAQDSVCFYAKWDAQPSAPGNSR
jgi:hypothetical protein